MGEGEREEGGEDGGEEKEVESNGFEEGEGEGGKAKKEKKPTKEKVLFIDKIYHRKKRMSVKFTLSLIPPSLSRFFYSFLRILLCE